MKKRPALQDSQAAEVLGVYDADRGPGGVEHDDFVHGITFEDIEDFRGKPVLLNRDRARDHEPADGGGGDVALTFVGPGEVPLGKDAGELALCIGNDDA